MAADHTFTTLSDLVEICREQGDKPALITVTDEGIDECSYARLLERSCRLAAGLRQCGMGTGTQIAVSAPSSAEWVIICLGIVWAGSTAVPLDAQYADDALQHVLRDSDARLVFTTRDQAERIRNLADENKPRIALLDVAADHPDSWEKLLAEEPGKPVAVEAESTAALFYTSGTTGRPKGVPLSHANLAFQARTVRETGIVKEGDRALLPLPLHHVYPLAVGTLGPLACGVPLVFPQALTGPQIVRAVKEARVTIIIGVPRLYRALLDGINARIRGGSSVVRVLLSTLLGLSRFLRHRLGLRWGRVLLHPLHRQIGPDLRLVTSGGSALDPDIAWTLEALGWQLAVGYGLTETAPLLTLDLPGSLRIGSVGRPVAGVELRIDQAALAREDDDDSPGVMHGSDRNGEILATGPGVFSGYRNLPEESESAFTADGWFRTGDMGRIDEDGYVHVMGRLSTLMVMEGGENVQPEEVEDAYEKHPLIQEIGVLQKNGRLVAVVVPDLAECRKRKVENPDETVRAAIKEVSRELPSYQRITEVRVDREALARTRLGKLRRHLLKERYEAAGEKRGDSSVDRGPLPVNAMSDRDQALLDDAAARTVWELLARKYPDARLTPDTHIQLDLGMDSLEWVSLTLQLRQDAGVELSEGEIAEIETVRDLLQTVAGRREGEGAEGPDPLDHPEEVLDDAQKRWLQPLGMFGRAAKAGAYYLNRAVMKGIFRLQVRGLDNLPSDGSFVIAPNHVSYLDPPAIAAAIGLGQLRRIYWAGWVGAAFRNWIMRGISRLAQAVPIDPQRAAASSLAFGAAVLQRQRGLVWFPEGGRSRDGQLKEFRPGLGLLLEKYDVPVVPVVIRGAYEAMPVGRAIPRPRRITVVFGKPVRPSVLRAEREDGAPSQRLMGALHDRVAALAAEDNGGM
jgi:long-chain acyl-CoA synthetase